MVLLDARKLLAMRVGDDRGLAHVEQQRNLGDREAFALIDLEARACVVDEFGEDAAVEMAERDVFCTLFVRAGDGVFGMARSLFLVTADNCG